MGMMDDEDRAKALTKEIYGDQPITANMSDDPKHMSRKYDDNMGTRGRDGGSRGDSHRDGGGYDRRDDRSGGGRGEAGAYTRPLLSST
jgi:ATP-dependent RNA helicase DHX8/PRP22